MATVLDTPVLFASRTAQPVLTFDQADRLVEQFGSPLLVISRSALIRNYETLRSGLPGIEFFYAAKANPDHIILSTLQEIGCSVDVCSYGELQRALRAGFSTDAMIHTHPCKTPRNLADCYAEGVRWFTFDNVHEIPKLVRYAPDASLLLRLAVSSASSLINLSAKFGAATTEAAGLMRAARDAGLNVRGMSFHVGSQCLAPEDFQAALARARFVWDEAKSLGVDLEVLDIGGGLPAPYRTDVLSLEEYCRYLRQALDEAFGDVPARIIAEPGRVLCADAATLVTGVIGKSMRNGLPWYIIDDGLYGSFSGKVYDHADFPLLARDGDLRPVGPCVVAGPTCDSSDVVAADQELPDLEIGELLLVPTMGAYTSASASGFNGLDIARSIAID
jgi:ornithine decarboxylase